MLNCAYKKMIATRNYGMNEMTEKKCYAIVAPFIYRNEMAVFFFSSGLI